MLLEVRLESGRRRKLVRDKPCPVPVSLLVVAAQADLSPAVAYAVKRSLLERLWRNRTYDASFEAPLKQPARVLVCRGQNLGGRRVG